MVSINYGLHRDTASTLMTSDHRIGPRPWRLCVAPMMGYTDRHFRHLLRRFSANAVLYTEMVTSNALIRRGEQFIEHDDQAHHTALQIGGSDPDQLAECARIAERAGYAEINLNVGCPSPRVSKGRFGACLMAEPTLVRECLLAMRAACALPVTVKCRLGIDDSDEPFLHRFTDAVEGAVDALIVHSRIALLEGLTPEQNREIPPLQYPRTHALRERHPRLTIVLNGGLTNVESIQPHMTRVDGVMLGRAICAHPRLLAHLDAALFGSVAATDATVLTEYVQYMHDQLRRGASFGAIAKRALGLFTGMQGARQFRREVTRLCHQRCTEPDALLDAARHIESTEGDARQCDESENDAGRHDTSHPFAA